MSTNHPSIRVIAQLAGVSIATVSRVINNNGRFSEATRERVLRVIDEQGYVANMAAKSLRSAKSRNVGMIVPDISNDFFSAIALHVERHLAARGYSAFVCNSGNDPQRELDYFRTLTSKLVDGVLCISGLNTLSDEALPDGIPVVCIDRYPENERSIPRVSSEDIAASNMATEHLIAQGCQRILFISSYTARHSRRDRFEGYRQALEAHGMPILADNLAYVTGERPSMEEADNLVHAHLHAHGLDFDGVFASSDHAAVGALRALTRSGVAVPEQVKIAGFDNSVYAQLTSPAITSVERHPDELARQGCNVLLQLIDGGQVPATTLVSTELIVRASSRRVEEPPSR